MSQSNSTPHRTIRSFVLREGRFTAAQKKAFTRLWPNYGVSTGNQVVDFDGYFPKAQPVYLDVGFGNGDSLLAIAQQYSEFNFIGVEVYRPGIGNVLRRLHEKQLTNVRIVNADVVDLLRNNLATDYLQGMLVWFPDPWPKKRHHKRRLVNESFLLEAARVIKNNGVLYLASDWPPYIEVMTDLLAKLKIYTPVVANSTQPIVRPSTRYEQRGKRLGHHVTDLIYQVVK